MIDRAFDITALLHGMLIASLTTIGWSLALNVPRQNLWQCVLIAAMAFGLRNGLLQFQFNLISATFWAAMLSGFLGIYLSRRYLVTPKALIVPGIVCMMPGITAYKAMVSLIQLGYHGYSPELFTQMMQFFVNAMFVMAALVFGLSLPATIFYRKQPIV